MGAGNILLGILNGALQEGQRFAAVRNEDQRRDRAFNLQALLGLSGERRANKKMSLEEREFENQKRLHELLISQKEVEMEKIALMGGAEGMAEREARKWDAEIQQLERSMALDERRTAAYERSVDNRGGGAGGFDFKNLEGAKGILEDRRKRILDALDADPENQALRTQLNEVEGNLSQLETFEMQGRGYGGLFSQEEPTTEQRPIIPTTQQHQPEPAATDIPKTGTVSYGEDVLNNAKRVGRVAGAVPAFGAGILNTLIGAPTFNAGQQFFTESGEPIKIKDPEMIKKALAMGLIKTNTFQEFKKKSPNQTYASDQLAPFSFLMPR